MPGCCWFRQPRHRKSGTKSPGRMMTARRNSIGDTPGTPAESLRQPWLFVKHEHCS
jgi:hypothetical protein